MSATIHFKEQSFKQAYLIYLINSFLLRQKLRQKLYLILSLIKYVSFLTRLNSEDIHSGRRSQCTGNS